MNIEISKEGVVTKDGEIIGQIQDGVCLLKKKIGPTVKAAINSENDEKLKFVVEGSDSEEDESGDGAVGPIGDAGGAGVLGPDDSGARGPSGPEDAPAASPHDPMPERDPILGAKCPKLIAWKLRQKGGK